eukprot:TRINITY_DN12624_c0_g1_i1.p1 TRINITY_DN12624_c0_g1~~TRINITY_DN12624_c0_g1_i1.p1  ORF type:complete len:238 (-),score=35.77 TRINITY_DN12624_c0_g1_i1:42-755(-)
MERYGKAKYDYIFFDWMGTLSTKKQRNFDDDIIRLHNYLKNKKFDICKDKLSAEYKRIYPALKQTTNFNWPTLFEQLWESLNLDSNDPVLDTIMHDFLHQVHTLYPGTIEVLQHIKDLSIPIGMIRNSSLSRVQMRRRLETVEVDHFFEVVVMAGEVGTQKPSPEVFLLAVEEAGIKHIHEKNPERIIYVGNETALDIVGANNLGWTTVLVCNTEENSGGLANHDINAISELKTLLQ